MRQFLIALAVCCAVPCWANPSTFSVSGNTLTIKGGQTAETGGNGIYLWPADDNGAPVWVLWDYSSAGNNKPGRNCNLDPDDGYVHCPRQGVTKIAVALGQNVQNSFAIVNSMPLPEISIIQLSGSKVLGGIDGVVYHSSQFPNLLSFSTTEGAPGRFHTWILAD